MSNATPTTGLVRYVGTRGSAPRTHGVDCYLHSGRTPPDCGRERKQVKAFFEVCEHETARRKNPLELNEQSLIAEAVDAEMSRVLITKYLRENHINLPLKDRLLLLRELRASNRDRNAALRALGLNEPVAPPPPPTLREYLASRAEARPDANPAPETATPEGRQQP
jgi:hypothetical protein